MISSTREGQKREREIEPRDAGQAGSPPRKAAIFWHRFHVLAVKDGRQKYADARAAPRRRAPPQEARGGGRSQWRREQQARGDQTRRF
jgi:hypothetical protein